MDIIADALVAIKNATKRKLPTVDIPKTNLIEDILKIMKREGYINDYIESKENRFKFTVSLKYYKGNSVITDIKKITKLSRRVYVNVDKIPVVMNNFGIAILSTSKGVLTDKEARALNVGGEVICYIW